MGNSIRIHTTPGGGDKYVNVKIDQDFDFLEVLSIKIRQEEIYRQYCSDHGVLVGRVLLNDGFGAPNCKVSIFIPLDENDEENPLVTALYPYKSPSDTDANYTRYNLFPDSKQNPNHVAVGTFPRKRRVINHDVTLYVYDKYYKFTTQTNSSGDFMIFGIPTGNQSVHFDLDLGDMESMSLSPGDLIESGVDEQEFEDIGGVLKFKTSNNLNMLPQIKSTDLDVIIMPLWGDKEQCTVGITRLDWSVNGLVIPSALFFGSVMSEFGNNCVSRNCLQQESYVGFMEKMEIEGLGGDIAITRVKNGVVEFYGNERIDDNGRWAFTLPMYEGRMVTDSTGVKIPSGNSSGIPTYGDYRFEFRLDKETSHQKSEQGLGIILAPNWQIELANPPIAYSEGVNTPTHSVNGPLDTVAGVTAAGANDIQSTNTTGYYLGYFHDRAYHFYYRFKAGGIFSILQNWNFGSDKFGDIPVIKNCKTLATQTPIFWTEEWGWMTGAVGYHKDIPGYKYFIPIFTKIDSNSNLSETNANDSRVVGCLYFPQFKIGSDWQHCENLVWGSSSSGGQSKEDIGGAKSSGPYYYIQAYPGVETSGGPNNYFDAGHATMGRTDIKDLTVGHDFFQDAFATLDPGLPNSSRDLQCGTSWWMVPNISGYISGIFNNQMYNIDGSRCYYVYFGIKKNNTSLDLVKQKYSV